MTLSLSYTHLYTQHTKEICVQIYAINISKAFGGVALLLNSPFSSVWVNRGYDENPGLIDQLGKAKWDAEQFTSAD